MRFLPLLLVAVFPTALAQGSDDAADAAAAMARALQDPLASIRMLATDNTIAFNAGEDEGDTNFNFQLQPVYSIPTAETSRFNYILRGVIPIIGLEPGVVEPLLGPEPTPSSGSTWGLSDTTIQFFISPKSSGTWKWGVGPQVSIPTHTSDRTAGPGWGAGLAGVLAGGWGNLSFAMIALHHVGDEDRFEVTGLQPMLIYNFPSVPGLALGYNNMITYNHKAESGQELNLPLGLTLSRTWALKNGDGLDLGLGYYEVIERPRDAPDSQIKFSIIYLFN